MATGRIPTTANSPLTVKGDLFGYSTTQARVPVGNDGETLVADSSTTTGLRYQADFAAGKNKIINGDFFVNQRAFTSSTSSNIFPADRWRCFNAGGTVTTSLENFTPGTAPVAGYEGRTFLRTDVTGQSANNHYVQVRQSIEDVTNFAGETVTLSFWAKAATGTPSIAATFFQNFGTGGSPSAGVQATTAQKKEITTSWARYSYTFAIASISGKTLGTTPNTSSLTLRLYLSGGSDFDAEDDSLGIQTNTFDIWGVQIEAGSVATAFQTATGTIQGELAACQRYFEVLANGADATNEMLGTLQVYSTTQAFGALNFKTTKRGSTTLTISGNTDFRVRNTTAGTVATTTMAAGTITPRQAVVTATVASGLTAGSATTLELNSATGYIWAASEL